MEEASMQDEPKTGQDVRVQCALPAQGRVRPEELLRRKLMQKMIARRERRAAQSAGLVRRVG
jgi:hypothetical protein